METGLLWLGLDLSAKLIAGMPHVHPDWSPPKAKAGKDAAASRHAARQAARVALARHTMGRNSAPALG